MDIRERMADGEEALRTFGDSLQAKLWTAMPGIVQAFDPVACTASVQIAVQGQMTLPDGSARRVDLPLLTDVPVVFPHGGGFVLTFPIRPGDECEVWFQARCMDAWWQGGGVAPALSARKHDLSDGICLVGPFSQAQRPPVPVSATDAQLRTMDSQAFFSVAPDRTLTAQNPAASVTLTPGGEISAKADAKITLAAPLVEIRGNLTATGYDGGAGYIRMTGHVALEGGMDATADVTASGVSLNSHTHTGVQPGPGDTGRPQ